MKLCRIGSTGKEKPAIIDGENNYRDLSSLITDFNPETLNFDTINKINKTDISSLPKLESNTRIGACVSNNPHLQLIKPPSPPRTTHGLLTGCAGFTWEMKAYGRRKG